MIKGIVFDLDGTLWQTGASYIYAYHKLCDIYGVTQRVSDDIVKAHLGIKIDKVLLTLFPMVENRRELTLRALQFSVEYLLEHPEDCCYDGVREVLERLSNEYPVYIVSNCLRAYADAFVSISNTAAFIRGIRTIEDGEKTEHLRAIGEELGGKLLFVGDSTDDYEALSDHYTQYFCYAEYGYKPCEHYDYAISDLFGLIDVLGQIAIKERQTNGKPYRTFSAGKNQITLMKQDTETSYFGFVRYADDRFESVIRDMVAACDTKLIGPIDSNTYYPYRFAVDQYDWRLYPDRDGERELPLFLKNGFTVHQEYVSMLSHINHIMWRKAKRAKLSEEYRTEILYGDAVYERLEDIYTVAVEAFAEAYFYEPISCRDFIDLYTAGLYGIVPDLVIIYRKEVPVAFCFCYEDPEKRFYVCKTIAVKRSERDSNVILRLIDCAYTMTQKRGYSSVLHHFMNLKSKKSISLFQKGFIKQKTYALLEHKA